MSNFDDETTFEEETPPEEGSNRTFLIFAGILGGLVLLGLLCVVGYILFTRTNSQQTEATALQQATYQAATIQAGLTSTAAVRALTQTAAVTNTVPPTNTPVIAQPTVTASPTQNPATATVGAAFTQIAVSTGTVISTSTALPNTGFADDIGAPGLLLMAIALVVVIFLVRRLRAAPTR
jgi:TRAP-type C4-dicarboxylate transport system permease small subunit